MQLNKQTMRVINRGLADLFEPARYSYCLLRSCFYSTEDNVLLKHQNSCLNVCFS